jgi:hypothetical protein
MNIAHLEVDYDLVAKTCGCKGTKKKVTFIALKVQLQR